MNTREEGETHARNLRGRASDEATEPGTGTGRTRVPFRLSLLVLLLVAAVLFFRSFGDELSGTSVVRDSISSGPSVRPTNAAGQVRVEGAEGLESVEYGATKHATTAADPAGAKERASGVPADVSREDGGRGTGEVVREPPGSSGDEGRPKKGGGA